MGLFRKGEDEVIAHQLADDNAATLAAWCNGRLVQEIDALDPDKKSPGINVPTPVGMQRASVGSMIVMADDGSFTVHREGDFLREFQADDLL